MPNTHLILGHASDAHAQHMLAAMQRRGHAVHLLQSDGFPHTLKLSLSPGQGGGSLRLADGSVLDLARIGSVYWRNFCGVTMETSRHQRGSLEDVAYYDSMACLRSWFQLDNETRWFNSWEAYQSHQEKPQQLHLVARAGVRIPDTYIGNDPEQVRAFCAREARTLFKPVYGGAHSQLVTPRHLESERLETVLRQAPITLQRYIEGTNIRTYAIGAACYSIELRSDATDFRADASVKPVITEIPAELSRQVRSIMQVLGLQWTAIDWRRDPDGVYYFLEANPSPMFMGVEHHTGLPLTDTLIDALAH